MYFAGLDVGTTSLKTAICDQDGKIVYTASREQHLHSEHPGWAEEDPHQWWENAKASLRKSLQDTGIPPEEIKAVGVAGMVPALVLLDEGGRVLRRSIQQNDARTTKEIRFLKETLEEDAFFRTTGGSINQQLIGPKVLWLKEHEPDVYRRTATICGSYDYVNFKLTGRHVLEHNWALESGLLNIATKTWEWDLAEACSVKPEWLSDVVPSAEVIGEITREAAEATGLREGTPVVGGVADHVASAFAAGLKEEGDLNVKLGGAGDILYSLDRLVTDRRLFIDYHVRDGKYMINGCMASSGSLIRWFRDEFCQHEVSELLREGDGRSVFAYLDARAERVPPGAGGVVVLPYFLGAKTPLHDPSARGVVFGLGLNHSKAHVYRALLEGVAYEFKHHVEVLHERGLEIKNVVATDGGAASLTWRQILADVLGEPLAHIAQHPGSSLGAAFVAGRAVGGYASWHEIDKFVKVESVVEPNPNRTEVYEKHYRIYRGLYEDLRERFTEL